MKIHTQKWSHKTNVGLIKCLHIVRTVNQSVSMCNGLNNQCISWSFCIKVLLFAQISLTRRDSLVCVGLCALNAEHSVDESLFRTIYYLILSPSHILTQKSEAFAQIFFAIFFCLDEVTHRKTTRFIPQFHETSITSPFRWVLTSFWAWVFFCVFFWQLREWARASVYCFVNLVVLRYCMIFAINTAPLVLIHYSFHTQHYATCKQTKFIQKRKIIVCFGTKVAEIIKLNKIKIEETNSDR